MTRYIPIAVLILTLLACSLGASTPTPNTQATIDAAVAATDMAKFSNQATIDAAVAATDTAQAAEQETVELAVEATQTTEATATDSAEETTAVADDEYTSMSEEELAVLVDQSVADAVATTEQSTTATTTATADNTLTTDEVQTIEVTVTNAEEAIALAEELLTIYASLYGTPATEAVTAIEELNQTLIYLADAMTALNTTLTEINSAVTQGLEITEETIGQLETAAQLAAEKAGQMQVQQQAWVAIRQNQPVQLSDFPVVEANQIATNPTEAMQQTLEFMQTGQQAMADGQLSPDEVAVLAQLAANAGAGLNSQNMSQVTALVENATTLMGQGDLTQAQAILSQLGVETILALPPNETAGDLNSAIQMARNFAETGQQSLADGQVSAAELAQLAQAGTNATAGLNAHGGPQMQQLTGAINDITSQLVRGDIPQAQSAINGFGKALESVPDIKLPGLPGRN